MNRQSPAPRDRRLWTKSEDGILRVEAEAQASRDGSVTDWCAIADNLPSRTNKDCRKRWSKISGGVSKGPWSEAEDDRLRSAVANRGTRWTEVSKSVETRNADQCSKRWLHFLDPRLDRGKWSQEDDCKLLHAVRDAGTDWKRICERHFPSRSATNVKNRFNNIKQRNRLDLKQAVERSPRRSSESTCSTSPCSSAADPSGHWISQEKSSSASFQILPQASTPPVQGDATFAFPQDFTTWESNEALTGNHVSREMGQLLLPNLDAEWSRNTTYNLQGAMMNGMPEQQDSFRPQYAPASTSDHYMQLDFKANGDSYRSQPEFHMPQWTNSNEYLGALEETAHQADMITDQRFGIMINEIPPNAVTGLVSYLSNSDFQYTIRREGSTSRTDNGTMLRSQRAQSPWSSTPGTVSVQIGELTLPSLRQLMGLLNASAFRGHAHVTTE